MKMSRKAAKRAKRRLKRANQQWDAAASKRSGRPTEHRFMRGPFPWAPYYRETSEMEEPLQHFTPARLASLNSRLDDVFACRLRGRLIDLFGETVLDLERYLRVKLRRFFPDLVDAGIRRC